MATNIGNTYGAFGHDQVSPDAFYDQNGWEGASPRMSEGFARANGELAGNNGPSLFDMLRKILGYHGRSDASTQNGPGMFTSGGYNHDPSPGPVGKSIVDPDYVPAMTGAFETPDQSPQGRQQNIRRG